VTSDGYTVFRDGDSLKAAKLSDTGETHNLADKAGNVLIKGAAVFNWADMDWMANTGDLSVWTASGGTRKIGITPYVEALAAATDDGSAVVYLANTDESSADLMIAGAGSDEPQTLIEGMGLSSEKTCGAKLGFVGKSLFVGWCEPDSLNATLQRFDLGNKGWEGTTIAEGVLPSWSADATGKRVFYQSSNYEGLVSDGDTPISVDVSVSTGQIAPDGSFVLYTVGDQLRRSNLDDRKPVPIVTRGYKQPVQFSPSFDLALYSTTVTYDNGTQRDLFMASTEGYNKSPIQLVDEPQATLGRSAMTTDGQYVAYLTDITASGGTLHVVDRNGDERLTRSGVVEVAAGAGSTLVFTDNSSDPSVYPVVTDLNVVDLASGTKPVLVEAKVLDGKNFQVDASGTSIAYVRSGVDRDEGASARNGLFFRTMLR
jgi:hypothetical protein